MRPSTILTKINFYDKLTNKFTNLDPNEALTIRPCFYWQSIPSMLI